MANLVVVAPPFHGHLTPMSALAKALAARGHQVTFAADIDGAGRLACLGHVVDIIGLRSHAPGRLAQVEARMAAVRGVAGLGAVVRDMAFATDMVARELPAVVERRGAGALIVDQLEPAGGLVARGLGVKHVSVAAALPIGGTRRTPPFFSSWPPARTRWQSHRAETAARVADWMMRELNVVIARHARRFGLSGLQSPRDCLSPALDIAQLPPELDYASAPAAAVALGPFRWPVEPPLRRASPTPPGRPLIFASLGSLFGGRADILAAVVRATRSADADVVIAHGGRLSGTEFGPLPPRVTLTSWADQRTFLARATLCITHAGMNTVLDAAAAGVPMVAVPIAFDQPGIAARLVHAGVGRMVTPGLGFAGRLAGAVTEVLGERACGERAIALAERLAARDPLASAVAAVEDLLDGKPAVRRGAAPSPPPAGPAASMTSATDHHGSGRPAGAA